MKPGVLIITLLFTLTAYAQKKNGDTTSSGKVHAYTEKRPIPGYDLNTYLAQNMHYPEKARKANIEGRVVIKFVVNEDGHISDCMVVSGIGGACDKEALRVVRHMPPWQPGMLDGKPVKVYFNLPITFKLED